MPFKITVTEITGSAPEGEPGLTKLILPTVEIYSQTLAELNLPALIRTLNPTTRRRKKVKDAAA